MIAQYLKIIAASRRRASTGEVYDSDAQAYFNRIVAAGTSITEPNKAAVNAFVLGCKADGNWSQFKSAVLLCGYDNLVDFPLVSLISYGSITPYKVNFISSDYDRTTGLKGNGSSKAIACELRNSDQTFMPRYNRSMGVYCTTAEIESDPLACLIGQGSSILTSTGISRIRIDSTGFITFNLGSGQITRPFAYPANRLGLVGCSRENSGDNLLEVRHAGIEASVASTADNPASGYFFVFARSGSTSILATPTSNFSKQRISFYWFGLNVNMALLESRLDTLMASLT